MNFALFRRRTLWWPTWKGWLLFIILLVAPVTAWAWFGEAYLTRPERVPADTLVIESWIQPDGLHAGAAEYQSGNYRHLVVTGGLTGSKGTVRRRSYIAMAERELVDAGIAKATIIPAPMPDVDYQRTYEMALAVRRALEERELHPAAVNIFTSGAHARRSQLVYRKVFGSNVKVGVISWGATEGRSSRAWWTSSERTLELFKETLGYTYELLFSSGRSS